MLFWTDTQSTFSIIPTHGAHATPPRRGQSDGRYVRRLLRGAVPEHGELPFESLRCWARSFGAAEDQAYGAVQQSVRRDLAPPALRSPVRRMTCRPGRRKPSQSPASRPQPAAASRRAGHRPCARPSAARAATAATRRCDELRRVPSPSLFREGAQNLKNLPSYANGAVMA